MADEHAAALLQREYGIGHGLAVLVADQHAVVAVRDFALHFIEAVEDVADQAGAARHGHEVALEADQAARRNAVLEPHAAERVDHHVGEFGAARAERFHHRALAVGVDVDGQRLEGLERAAVDDLLQHLRLADGELEAFAAHVLDQDRQVQFAAPRDAEHVGLVGFLDAQRDVALQFAHQPFADLAAGDEFALAPGERRGVDLEIHHQRRFVDLDRRQALGALRGRRS